MHVATRFLIALCWLPAAASANELLTVYDRALQHDATLQAAQHARDAAAQAYPQARAVLLPQLSAGYGISYKIVVKWGVILNILKHGLSRNAMNAEVFLRKPTKTS